MPNLPLGKHTFYAAADPGFSGGFAVMNATGTIVKTWDMPTTEKDMDRQREMDLDGLRSIYAYLRRLPDLVLGIEWPTTRPGEGAERCERFGRGKGYLEAFAYLNKIDYYKLAPNLWKGRLGLPGKELDPNSRKAAKFFETFYPDRAAMIRGPRGGVIDGRLDALLMCHFLRCRSSVGLKSVVDRYGKDSPEVYALVFGGRRKKKQSIASSKD